MVVATREKEKEFTANTETWLRRELGDRGFEFLKRSLKDPSIRTKDMSFLDSLTRAKVDQLVMSSKSDDPILKINKETGKYYMDTGSIKEYQKQAVLLTYQVAREEGRVIINKPLILTAKISKVKPKPKEETVEEDLARRAGIEKRIGEALRPVKETLNPTERKERIKEAADKTIAGMGINRESIGKLTERPAVVLPEEEKVAAKEQTKKKPGRPDLADF